MRNIIKGQRAKGKGQGRRSRVLLAAFVICHLSFFIFHFNGDAAVVSYRSPAIWRVDGEGDYLIPKANGNLIEPQETIVAKGIVTSVTLNYEFSGEVRLKVSVNGGKSYFAAVNGVPLEIQNTGVNEIKWQAELGDNSRLSQVAVSYTDTYGVIGSFGAAQLSGFKYRKKIIISNNNKQDLFNYQMKLAVGKSGGQKLSDFHCEGKVHDDFSDLRWTAADRVTVLPYYIEEVSGQIAYVWVKIPQIPQGSVDIYVYYGNEKAQNLSSAYAVFDFFDDFNGENIDTDKWKVQADEKGEAVISSGLLKLSAAKILSKDYEMQDGIIEYRAQAFKGGEIRCVIREQGGFPDATQRAYASTYQDTEHSIVIGSQAQANKKDAITLGGFYEFRIIAYAVNLEFARYKEGFSGLEAVVAYIIDNQGITSGCVGMEVGGIGRGDRVSCYDWIRVRKYVQTLPSVNKSGSEEEVELPCFTNTAINRRGDLTLAPAGAGDEKSGTYLYRNLSTQCGISRITLSWQAVVPQDTSLKTAVSANSGVDWKTDCNNGGIYTSVRDFSSGTDMALDLNFSSEGKASASVSEVTLDYSTAPVVTAQNIKCLVAAGAGGAFQRDDTLIVAWDNSSQGDNNIGIESVSCDFSKIGGTSKVKMADNGKDKDEVKGDNVWTAKYKLSVIAGSNASIYVSAVNACGETAKAGKIISVNTTGRDLSAYLSEDEEEQEVEVVEEEVDLDALFSSKRKPRSKLYDVLIKLRERSGVDTEGRFRKGDILMVKPHGFRWSETEKQSYLIIQLYLTEEETQILTMPQEVVSGEVDEEGIPVKKIMKQRKYKIDLDKVGLTSGVLENTKKLESIKRKAERRPLDKTVVKEKE